MRLSAARTKRAKKLSPFCTTTKATRHIRQEIFDPLTLATSNLGVYTTIQNNSKRQMTTSNYLQHLMQGGTPLEVTNDMTVEDYLAAQQQQPQQQPQPASSSSTDTPSQEVADNESSPPQEGRVLRGRLANLSRLRVITNTTTTSTNSTTTPQITACLAQDESILHPPLPVLATLHYETSNNSQAMDSTLGPTNFDNRQGYVMITTARVLFWRNASAVNNDNDESTTLDPQPQTDDNTEDDLAIDAVCIDLHAISSSSSNEQDDDKDNNDPPSSSCAVYLQIQPERQAATGGAALGGIFGGGLNESEETEDAPPLLELTLQPKDATDTASTEVACQTLFDALSQLIALHPILDDDDEEGPGFGGPGGMPEMDDQMVWAGSIAQDTDNGEATPEERQAMLERLDNILVVPPELEVHSDEDGGNGATSRLMVQGQFDDAEDDEDDNADLL